MSLSHALPPYFCSILLLGERTDRLCFCREALNAHSLLVQGFAEVARIGLRTDGVHFSPGSSMQQIGLSVPVIIIKQEEACQCQCACRDSVKDKSSSGGNNNRKACSPPDSKTSRESPASGPQPPAFPAARATNSSAAGLSSMLPPSCERTTLAGNPLDSQTQSLSAMDVSDFLSLQSPKTPSPLNPIEALLQGEEELALGSTFPK